MSSVRASSVTPNILLVIIIISLKITYINVLYLRLQSINCMSSVRASFITPNILPYLVLVRFEIEYIVY